MASKLIQRKDTAANWTSANTVLSSGEIGVETDTGKIKIGNGTQGWTVLSYAGAPMPTGTVVGTSDAQTLTNKTINLTNNTLVANSLQILSSVTDETGTANLVFSNTPTLITPVGVAANIVVQTSGTSWTIPSSLRTTGARWKVTIVGGGGQGGGTAATAGQTGSGGGSGAVVVGYYQYVVGQDSMSYAIGGGGSTATAGQAGQSGTNSTTTYNSITFTAGGGGGGSAASSGVAGAAGTATGGTWAFNGFPGSGGGTMAATNQFIAFGGDTPLGLGQGGRIGAAQAALAGSGYGAGGSGFKNGATATGGAGGAGAAGVLIIEY